jgi:hypothetical protein
MDFELNFTQKKQLRYRWTKSQTFSKFSNLTFVVKLLVIDKLVSKVWSETAAVVKYTNIFS